MSIKSMDCQKKISKARIENGLVKRVGVDEYGSDVFFVFTIDKNI